MHASRSVSAFPSTAARRHVTHAPLQRCAQLMLGMLALASGSAMATTFCVDTGNELSTAMETAAVNGQNDEIRIRTGRLTRSGAAGTVPRWEYDIGAGVGDVDYSVSISGGWTDCSTQVADPRLTELDAQYQGSAMHFALYSGNGNVTVSNLTITRGLNTGATLARIAANLGVSAPYSTSTIQFERLIVVAGSSTNAPSAAGGIKVSGFGPGDGSKPTFNLRNNVVAYNAGGTVGGIYVNVTDSVVNITNNSIFSNTAASSGICRCAGLNLTNDAFTYVSNNVVVNNADGASRPSDVRNDLGSTYLRNNHIGYLFQEVMPVINVGTTTGAPGWTIISIYPIPDANSPLRDSGANAPSGGTGTADLAGNARIVNGRVDRGAIEAAATTASDRIFTDTFE